MKASHSTIHSLLLIIIVIASGIVVPTFAQSKARTTEQRQTDHKTGSESKVDLNAASQKELEDLPGVGAATAKKIISGRPYSSVSDLSKAGVSAKTIEKITPLVKANGSSGSGTKSSDTALRSDSTERNSARSKTGSNNSSDTKVDLNSASQSELEALPSVGPATAKKIMSGRPYSSASDLSKAGVSAKTIDKIMPLVTASGNRSESHSSKASPSEPTGSREHEWSGDNDLSSDRNSTRTTSSRPEPRTSESEIQAPAPPSKGMVWVNLDSKIYHREGTRWYGKTKNGKYMSEADAIAAGFRASKQ
ncbi:MAG: hypothetical protein JWO13_1656 [Acidobacteriales bacterium]|nr:hypothetical protein [Terriglobales bacterium]